MSARNALLAMEKEEIIEHYMAAAEMLAAVLNETGPVVIDKQNRKPIPPDASVMVDVDNDAQTATISLVSPDASG